MRTRYLTMVEAAAIALGAGFTPWRAITMVAIAWGESGGNAWAVGVNPGPPLSLDVGVLQWNTYWHPDFTVAEMLDPVASFARARTVTKGGFENLHLWHAYTNKMHVPHMHAARVAVSQALGVPL